MKPIHEAMKEARERRGISQTALSRRSGIGQATICKMEAGQSEPRLYTVLELAIALGISLDEYVGREEATA